MCVYKNGVISSLVLDEMKKSNAIQDRIDKEQLDE